jgi:drug/metabolite transporter (DMT)-like permease
MTLALGLLLVILTTCGQLLLKMGARASEGGALINRRVVYGYLVLMLVVFVSYFLMHVTELKNFTVVMSASYVAVAITARSVLKEQIGKDRVVGTVLICIGIFVFLMD